MSPKLLERWLAEWRAKGEGRLVTHSIAGYHYSANWETCTDGTLTRWNID